MEYSIHVDSSYSSKSQRSSLITNNFGHTNSFYAEHDVSSSFHRRNSNSLHIPNNTGVSIPFSN